MSIVDIDGNTYDTVIIGTQEWTVQNFRCTKLNDGTPIPEVTGDAEWGALSTPGRCAYSNDSGNVATYGLLYNWYAVDTDKLAPSGWRVPTRDDMDSLESYATSVGPNAAKALASTTLWLSSENPGAVGNNLLSNNGTSMAFLPGGSRNTNGTWADVYPSLPAVTRLGQWWTSTYIPDFETAYRVYLWYNGSSVGKLDGAIGAANSVRLVRDYEPPIITKYVDLSLPTGSGHAGTESDPLTWNEGLDLFEDENDNLVLVTKGKRDSETPYELWGTERGTAGSATLTSWDLSLYGPPQYHHAQSYGALEFSIWNTGVGDANNLIIKNHILNAGDRGVGIQHYSNNYLKSATILNTYIYGGELTLSFYDGNPDSIAYMNIYGCTIASPQGYETDIYFISHSDRNVFRFYDCVIDFDYFGSHIGSNKIQIEFYNCKITKSLEHLIRYYPSSFNIVYDAATEFEFNANTLIDPVNVSIETKSTVLFSNFNIPEETDPVILQRWIDNDYNTGLFGEPRLGIGAFYFESTPEPPGPPENSGSILKEIRPVLTNKSRYSYKIGTDTILSKVDILKNNKLSYLNNIPIELWMNYDGTWQKYEDSLTDRFGSCYITHTTSGIPDITNCLGIVRVHYDEGWYVSNIIRYNFYRDNVYIIDAATGVLPDRTNYDIFDSSGRLNVFDRMYFV